MSSNAKKKPAPSGDKTVPVQTSAQPDIIHRPPAELIPYKANARRHDERQIAALIASIQEFGFTGVIVTNEEGMVLAGHGRLEAAKRLGLETVPTRVAVGLTKAQQRAYVLADNKISQMSTWDDNQLKLEIEQLVLDDFNVELTGFSTAEIDIMFDDTALEPETNDPDDLQPEDVADNNVSKIGDIWILGKHRLICGSALEHGVYMKLMDAEQAQMVITDPPFNVKVNGHVGGSGNIKHDEFVMASGEMSDEEFTNFLNSSFTLVEDFSKDGAIIFAFMDWRHSRHILDAAEPVFGPQRQLCVWAKDNGGMGSFYRSQHELVYVFKKGDAPHINNFGLGQYGRYRTNVWNYAGINSFKSGGNNLLKLHPTVKPVSMIADAIRDCSHHQSIVLDPFTGSGTILVAAERTGRYARAIELDPKYVDVAVRRWQRVTGEDAIHADSGLKFNEIANKKGA